MSGRGYQTGPAGRSRVSPDWPGWAARAPSHPGQRQSPLALRRALPPTAAVLIASEQKAAELGLRPRARFLGFGIAGVDPHLMLHGNPDACAKALAKAGLTWDDMSVIEVNEAFASVVLQFLADTGLGERWEAGDVNPNGGGISLGHPLGATGARITATLVSELERTGARYGIGAMCIGFGQAIAGVVERL